MKKFLALILTLAMVLSVCSFAAADDLPTITIMFHGSNVSDDSAVLEKVNEYIADKVGAKLEVVWGTWGDFDEKAVNILTSGDSSVDMIFTCSWSSNEYNSFAKKGYFLKLDDLFEQYGADLKAALPESLMQAATINGSEGRGIYAVNGFKDTATQNTWDINVTLLNELGYTVDDVKEKGFFGWDEIFAKAKEVKGDSFYPFLVEPVVAERMVTNSIIVSGDGNANLLSLYLNPDDVSAEGPYGNKLLNKFATPEYKAFAEQMHKYYEAGYIDPALSVGETSNDCRSNHQKDASYLIGTQVYSFGYEYSPDVLSRGVEVYFLSFKFLALLNTDPTLMTLMNYGVEGIHYNLDEDGLVVFTDERANYSPWTNGVGNVTLLPDTKDEGKGFRESFKAYYATGKVIPSNGFFFDPTNVETEMAQLANVNAQYALALDCGATDPETELPAFLEALDAAGIQAYLNEANAQMDAFLGQ